MTWEEVFADIELRRTRGIEVVPYPHPAIRHKAVKVEKFSDDLKKLVQVMYDIMYDRKGCGLAATQLGLPFRLFVINPTGDPENKDKERAFVNPTISPKVQRGKTRTYKDTEGCLSIPGLMRAVERPHDITYEAFDADGKKFAGTYSGLTGRVVQHEYDHLEGVLFTDNLDDFQRQGVEEWLRYMREMYNSLLDMKHFPPDDEAKKALTELENLVK